MGEVVELVDRDEQILKLRLKGESVFKIAKQFKIAEKEVLDALDRRLPSIDAAARVRMLNLDLERLAALGAVFDAKALDGDPQAAMISIKLVERRSAMMGFDVPVSVRIDAQRQADAVSPRPSGTDRILAAIERIRQQRPGGDDEGSPEPSPAAESPAGT
jgi:hypothetical protein